MRRSPLSGRSKTERLAPAAPPLAGAFRFYRRRGRHVDCGQARARADQHSRARHVLSDAPAGAGRAETDPGLPHLELCDGGRISAHGEPGPPNEDRSRRGRRRDAQPGGGQRDGEYSIEFVECLASCGTAPVCMVGDDLHEDVAPEGAPELLTHHSSPVTYHPPPHPLERRMIFKNIGREGYTTDIDCYLHNGGYEQLRKAVTMKPAQSIIDEVMKSGLRGRGGAGFSCGSSGASWTDERQADLPHLQRRRIRAGHVQGPPDHLQGPAPVDRGHDHLLLRERRASSPTSTSAAKCPRARRF